MISHITGKILMKGDKFVVLDVSGVGYKVYPPVYIINDIKINDIFSFWTHLVVREDVLDLYGFIKYEEVELFEMLIGISGVGPKSALGIMGVAPTATLKAAIASGDTSYLTKVSGIGKKNAEKIILELRDKLGVLVNEAGGETVREESDTIDALQAMGYSVQEAREALKQVSQEIKGTSARTKEALKNLPQLQNNQL